MTRIAIVDPQPAVRAGLAMLLRTEPGLVPVGAATGLHDGIELVERLRPGVVLLEHHLLDGDGLSMCRRLKALPQAPQVILYTADPDGALVLLARVACADGLVDKAADSGELFDAIRVVARGGTSPGDVADTLRLDRRNVGRRIERLLGRLRAGSPAAA